MSKKTQDLSILKSQSRLNINLTLIQVSFTILVLIITLKPSILEKTAILLQLTLSIPLILTSTFGNSKVTYATRKDIWEGYSFITFLIGYSFLVNVAGLLITQFIGLSLGLIFFIFNILVSITYSIVNILENSELVLVKRIKKDLLFCLLLVFGGILPALGLY
ncbi:MAG: hypothetical protein QXT40_01410 [Candidatus Micrarchaeia archaeon]